MDGKGTGTSAPAERNMEGIGSFPGCPATVTIENRPAEDPPCFSDIGKVCKNLFLEIPFGRKRLLRALRADQRAGVLER